jgi:hypothetical protein
MNSTKTVKAVAALFLLAVCALPAAADSWDFDFQSSVPGVDSVIGVITTSNTLNIYGNYDVTGITGTINGEPIDGLLPNPNQPNVFVAPDGNFWDNNLLPSAPYVDNNGIGFLFDGDEFVLFSGATSDPLSEGLFDDNANQTTLGTLSVTMAVSEAATWAFLLVGLLGLGLLGVARRKRCAAVAA